MNNGNGNKSATRPPGAGGAGGSGGAASSSSSPKIDMRPPTKGFRPEYPMRERICAWGGEGSGKTGGLLDVIKLNKITGGDAHLYMIESDIGSMARMLNASGSRFGSIRDRVTVFPVDEWPTWVDALDQIRGVARPHDWVGVDFITDAWDEVQRFYLHEIKGERPEDYFMEKKRRYESRKSDLLAAGKAKEVRGEDTGIEGNDWTVIKGLYNPWWSRLYARLCAHTYLIARERDVRDKFHPDKKITQSIYSDGVMPKGEGKVAHGPDTSAHFTTNGRGSFYLTTNKDRERPLLRNESLEKGFAKVYLRGVAGWVLR